MKILAPLQFKEELSALGGAVHQPESSHSQVALKAMQTKKHTTYTNVNPEE